MSNFDYHSVVVILPERLGDTLFHTPSLRLIKTLRPGINLEVIALSPLCAEVLQNNPFIDAIHVAPNRSETQRIAARSDIALLLHNHALARKYAAWLNIPVIEIAHCLTPKHWSQHSLDFTRELLQGSTTAGDNRYTLFPTATQRDHIAALLSEYDVGADAILIGCHIGCHSIAKRGLKFWRSLTHPKAWPLENFIALEHALQKTDSRFRLVLTGSKGERKLGEKFVKLAPRAINLIDKTSVLDLAALMDGLSLFITPDTGALHVACARDVGIIALFGPTQLQVTGPHPMRKNICVLQATQLKDISVDDVARHVLNHPDIVAKRMSESIP